MRPGTANGGEALAALRVLVLMSCRGWSSDAYWAGRVARELQDRGHHVTFLARAGTDEKVLSRLSGLGVRHLRTLAFEGRRSPRGTAGDVMVVRRLIAEHDIVHVHRGQEHWIASIANLLARSPIPLIRTRHIVKPVRNHLANRWLYARTAHVITVSRAIRARYVASGLLPPGRVTAILGGVDHRLFRPQAAGTAFRRARGLPDDLPLVGVVGGLRAMKGHRVFLEAAQIVSDRRPGARFVLVGDGPEAPVIRRLIGRFGLEGSVEMAGFVPDPAQAVSALDVAVYSSLASDGMGRVLYEYMAGARPIVATTVGLAPEVLQDRETALLVAPGEAAPLAQAIDRLLEDRAFARQAGERCLRAVEERYSGSVVAEAVEALYRAALADPAPMGSRR